MNLRLLFLLGWLCPASAFASSRAVVIDPVRSRVDVDVKSTIDSFVVHVTKFDAAITVGAAQEVTTARFRFKFSDLKTDDDERDRTMNEWQNTGRFPDGEFVLEKLEPAANGSFKARGRLRFHGVERTVDFPVTINLGKKTLAVDGAAALDTRDYGLPVFRRFLLLKVDPIVRVHFHLEGRRAAP